MDDHTPAADFHIQASGAASIGKLVLKQDESFIVSDRRGDFPAHLVGELGFYHRGTRYLRWLEIRLNGERPLLLSAEGAPDNDQVLVGLTNVDIVGTERSIPRNTIYLDRLLSLTGPHLLESFTIVSYHDAPCELALELIFAADFRDVFEVRGMHRPERGQLLGDERDNGTVRLRYRGLDGIVRTTRLTFSPPPAVVASNRAVYQIALEPNVALRLDVSVTASEDEAIEPAPAIGEAVLRLRAAPDRLRTRAVRVETDNDTLNALVARSLSDLEILMTHTDQGRVVYAGVPWFVAPFGRDSIITAIQLLPYQPDVAASTLRFLAAWQGRRTDDFRDEEPGKILHEYRQGEMANCREIPFIPYYGTVDATPLFVMLLAEYVRWTGDLVFAAELWPAACAAIEWMRRHGDRDGDRFLEYATRSPLGLANQGWKDSDDAVSHADGRLARTPIALVEVQGYAYAALASAAELAQLLGDDGMASALRAEASELRERFNRAFWIAGEEFLALALDADKQRCEVVTSNPAHALWTGIVDDAKAPAVAKRLLGHDMFSGWGIRTLGSGERRYNPMSYHNGSVWPHDNAIAAMGFRRYHMPAAVITVASAIFDAARSFEHLRLPELFCGFPRHVDYGPISYPVACSPQAWAAGSVLQILTALTGMEADATQRRITFHAPVLPPWLRFVELHNVRVGPASLDVAISRGRDGASVELINRRGTVELIVRR